MGSGFKASSRVARLGADLADLGRLVWPHSVALSVSSKHEITILGVADVLAESIGNVAPGRLVSAVFARMNKLFLGRELGEPP